MPKPIRHISVIRLSAMGDVAMTVPILLAFTEQYPEVKITMVSKSIYEPIFRNIPQVTFFEVDVNGKHNGILGLIRIKSELQNLGVEAIVDLHNVIRSKVITLLMKLSGIKCAKVDKGRTQKKELTRSENKIFKQLPTVFERNAKAFAELGFPLSLESPYFLQRQSLTKKAESLTGIKSEKWLGIAPFAKHSGKIYPKDLMSKVIQELAEENIKIFLFGAGDDEIRIVQEFAAGRENIIVTAGLITFGEELGLISNLDAMLSMDSANAHLAAMYGIPVITLWGATHPYAGFAPFNQATENMILSDRSKYPKLPTSIYGNKKVNGYEDAMRTISPETVIHKVKNILR